MWWSTVPTAAPTCPAAGTHRTREVIELPQVPAESYRARLCGPDLPRVSASLFAPNPTGRRGDGKAAPRRQPAQPDRHAAGRGAATHPQRPVVAGHRASVAPQRGGHRERHSPDRATGPTSGGRDAGPHPRQPSGPRRRNRLASEDGANGYVWTFSTPTERYFLRRGRGKAVVDEALGESFSGVLVSDFYAAYHHYDGPKQRCWAHLLRDIHDQRTRYPKDTSLAQWAAAVHQLYVEARSFTHTQARRRRVAQLAWERQLLAICQPFLADPLAVQAKLCRRIERHIKELFVFVAEPDVPADNNPAERSLRHLVISRKVSGGTRSERGTESKMTLASLFGTWRARGLNPLAACRQLLTSPQV